MVKACPQAPLFAHSVVSWCKGSTRDFDSLCLGSNTGETIIPHGLSNVREGFFIEIFTKKSLTKIQISAIMWSHQ